MIGLILATVTFAASPSMVELRVERVGLIEVNHYYDENGVRLLDQLIAYDWCELTGRYQVRDWRLIKSERQIPQPIAGGYVAIWGEGKQVEALHYRETWTQYDQELIERRHLAREDRRPLFSK